MLSHEPIQRMTRHLQRMKISFVPPKGKRIQSEKFWFLTSLSVTILDISVNLSSQYNLPYFLVVHGKGYNQLSEYIVCFSRLFLSIFSVTKLNKFIFSEFRGWEDKLFKVLEQLQPILPEKKFRISQNFKNEEKISKVLNLVDGWRISSMNFIV